MSDDKLVYNVKCRRCKKTFQKLNKKIMKCRECQETDLGWQDWYRSQETEE